MGIPRWLAGIVIVFTLAAFSCSNRGWNPFCPPSDPVEYAEIGLDSTSAEGTLNRLVWAYEQMDIECYISCLDSTFIFYFDSHDDGIQRLLRDCSIDNQYWWGYTEECMATRALFNEVRAANGSICLSMVGNVAWYPYYEDSTIVKLKRIYSLEIRPSPVSTPIEGEATFTLVQKPTGAWKILRWKDKKLAL
jgi:hypothetical protein